MGVWCTRWCLQGAEPGESFFVCVRIHSTPKVNQGISGSVDDSGFHSVHAPC